MNTCKPCNRISVDQIGSITVQGIHILGYFPTIEALNAHTNCRCPGDMYLVGETTPFHVHVWDGTNEEWVDAGPLTQGESPQIDYSMEEQWTGRRWIDGKKIYQKTVFCGGGPNATNKYIDTLVADVLQVVEMKAIAKKESSFLSIPETHLTHLPASTTLSVQLSRTGNGEAEIVIGSQADRRLLTNIYVTIFYTCTDR